MKPSSRMNNLFRAKNIRRLALFGIFVCLLLYNYIEFILDYVAYDKMLTGSHTYFVKQNGCHIVGMDVINPTILTFLHEIDEDRCERKQLLRIQYNKGAIDLVLNMQEVEIMNEYNISDLSELECEYCVVQRVGDKRNNCSEMTIFKLNPKRGITLLEEDPIVRVSCWNLKNVTEPVYKDVLFFIEPPLDWPLLEVKLQQQPVQHELLSAMIIGIDSVSHLNFLRQMKATAHFIHTQLSHVEFWGYNKVGENSYPNLIPLLSGLCHQELEKKCLDKRRNFDECQFLWHDFKAAGYNTCFGEDNKGGTFVYLKPGFGKPPTDYYLRPAVVEAYKHSAYESRSKLIYCTGGRAFSQLLFDFAYQLLPRLRIQPFYSFFWWVNGVHEDFMYSTLVDKNFLYMLKTFERQGIFNHTLVLLMADHGYRYGAFRKTYQGMLEDAQPLLIALYPAWMAQRYPLAIENLKSNAHSLITSYDLHETLKDIIDLNNLKNLRIKSRTKQLQSNNATSMPRGISLFLPIPAQRNCRHAGIPSHFCLCHSLESLPIDDRRVQRAARYVVERINWLLKPHTQCRQLHLNSILKAYIARPTSDGQENNPYDLAVEADRIRHTAYEIRVRIQTDPGWAQFEATTRFLDYSISLTDDITRVNIYGNQSFCINDYRLEKYCYCLKN